MRGWGERERRSGEEERDREDGRDKGEEGEREELG